MQQIILGKKSISSERPAFVMGIVNATPDSFFEKSRGGVELALQMIKDGADILDIGGESTRPGFSEVSEEQQIERIIPVIKAVRRESDIPISIDTRSSVVFEQAVAAGADILNDVSALSSDPHCASVVAKSSSSVILMHGFGLDENHLTQNDIALQTLTFLRSKTFSALENGIQKEKILWDPGIGFGKTMQENVLLLKSTDNLCMEQYPVVMALSRKRVISFMTGCAAEERLSGTLAANQIAVQKGAKILRVHDVKDTLNMLNIMKNLS